MTNRKTATKRGTLTEFDSLHGKLTAAMSAELDRCAKAGETPSPAFLSQVRAFLNENGVNVPEKDKSIDRLKGLLPSLEELGSDNIVPITRPA